MSAPKPASRTKPATAVGALLGFVGFSALAGLLVTIGVTPAIAVAGVTTTSTIGVFESLPEYIEIGDLPQRNELFAYSGGKSVPLATVYDQNREELDYGQMSDQLKHAAVDGEDRRFWQHGGVDVPSLVRAGVGSVAGGGLGDSGGASTLTMQLVRNIKMQQALALPTQAERTAAYNDAVQQTISRKLEEMKLAIGLAKKYSKKQILTAYLNIAYFGDQTYGVQAAAQHYFNKNATDLTPAEAASILAIVQSPNTRNLSDPKYYDANVARRDVILKAMLQQQHLTQPEYDQAIASKPADYVHLTAPTQGCKAATGNGAQFFCDYAVQVVKQMDQLGGTATERAASWRTGGYKIQTTLNLDITGAQKDLITRFAPNTESRFDLGGTIDSVETDTGRIISMAQNKNYNQLSQCGTAGSDPNACAPATDTGLNYSVDQSYGGGIGFQTGSTYKIFTLLDWLQQGHGLYESVNGTPRYISPMTVCGDPTTVTPGYIPKNDEGSERGYQSVLAATYRSVNVAYFSMAQKLDLCDIRSTAEKAGVHLGAPRKSTAADHDDLAEKSTTAPEVNPTSILGTNNIAPLTMASAYATVANHGIYCKPIAIDSITDANGKQLGGQTKDCQQAIDPSVAATAVYALKNVLTIGTAGGGRTADGYEEFAKTGTTDQAEQIWLVGSTTKVTTATWMGNTDGRHYSLRKYGSGTGTGYTYATSRTSLWRQAQAVANTQFPAGQFDAPSAQAINGNTVPVPDLTGKTAAEARTALYGAGLAYVDGGTAASAQATGTVASTSPAANTRVSKRTSVTVYTSDGSQSAVPDVAGRPAKDAAANLRDQGFTKVSVSRQFQKGGNGQACKVVSTDPVAGTAIAKSSPVTLTLYGTADGKDPGNCS